MKKFYAIPCILFSLAVISANAQAFRKGSILLSLSEGYTNVNYRTSNNSATDAIKYSRAEDGDRDPITFEYGLTKHWGVGINLGGDVFHVNPTPAYGFTVPDNRVEAITSELTVDAHYHFFVTNKTDLSAFASVGFADVTIDGNSGDYAYRYNAGGGIVRAGAQARYYFFRRLGVLGMASIFSASCSTKDVTDNTVGKGYSTSLKGYAIEFGLCYRVRR
jgi:hypothetical protein